MTSIISREETQAEVAPDAAKQVELSSETPTIKKAQDPWLALAGLAALGGISGIAYYLGFVHPYLLHDFYTQPHFDLARISSHTARAANYWALTWIVLFACYYLAFRFCPPSGNGSRRFKQVALFIICGFAAFYSINLIFMYPVGAADLFDQIFRARLTSYYNLNPFTTVPSSIVNDPLQMYVAWSGDPSPYGPVWELIAGGVSLLGGSDLWHNLILFKLLVTVAFGISVALTYGILRAVKPDWALRGTLFFAWNPLAIFEIAGNGHNDAIVIMFLLTAVYLLVKARRSLALAAIMAGALTKFVPVLLVPAAAASIWNDRVPGLRRMKDPGVPVRGKPLGHFDAFSTLAVGAALALGLALATYAPFWTGTNSIGALGRQALFTASIPKVALDALHLDAGVDERMAQAIVRYIALGLTAAVSIACGVYVLLGGIARTPEERDRLISRTLAAFYEVIFFYLAFASLWFQPWYLLWLVALTAPTARFTNANRTILFCIGGVANYFVWDFIWLWDQSPIRDTQIMSALAIYTLPLMYTLYIVVKNLVERTRRTPAS